MTSLVSNIKLYLTNNGKNYDDERFNFQVDADSAGKQTLVEWNVSGLTKPTDKQLSDLEADAVDLEDDEKIILNRVQEYPPWREQLDMIYHDLDDWRATIKAVKDKYPK